MRADTARIRNTEQELEEIRLRGNYNRMKLLEKRHMLKHLMQTDRGRMYGYRLEEQIVRLEEELCRLRRIVDILSEVRRTYERTEEQILRGDRRTSRTIRTGTVRIAELPRFWGQDRIDQRLSYPVHFQMPDTKDTREIWEGLMKS